MYAWKTSSLGDVSEMIKRGIGPKYLDEDGICVINQKCIRDHSVNYHLARRHDVESKKVNEERYVKAGDVLVNSTGTGTLGRVAQVKVSPAEPTTVDTHVTIVRPKPNFFYDAFFGYMLIKIEEEITSAGEGASGQTELARAKLENEFSVSYPDSIPEQQRIVAILDQAFADIDKARANAEQNLKNARELFDSYLHQVFSQRGDELETKTLGGACDLIKRGIAPKYLDVGGMQVVNQKCIRDHAINYSLARRHNLELKKVPSERLIEKGDVLVNSTGTGTLGRVAQVRIAPEEDTTVDTHVTIVRPIKNLFYNPFFGYMMVMIEKEITESGEGASGQTELSREKLQNNFTVSFPASLDMQRQMVTTLDSLSEKTKQLEATYEIKLKSLDELKKSLLQKAFSGELTKGEGRAA